MAGVLPQDPLTGGRDVFYSESDARTERAVQEAAEPVGARLSPCRASPARGLHGLAEQLDVDLLVVGSSHHGGIGARRRRNNGSASAARFAVRRRGDAGATPPTIRVCACWRSATTARRNRRRRSLRRRVSLGSAKRPCGFSATGSPRASMDRKRLSIRTAAPEDAASSLPAAARHGGRWRAGRGARPERSSKERDRDVALL